MNNPVTNTTVAGHTTRILLGFALVIVVGDQLLAHVQLPRIDGSTNMIHQKWRELRELDPQPTVVVLGSSYEEFAVNPRVIDSAASTMLGRPVTTFNLAAPATSLSTERLLVRHMVRRDRLPDLVYLGITPSAVDAARIHWHRGGLRTFGSFADLGSVWRTDLQLFVETLGASLFRSYSRWNDVRLIGQRLLVAAPLGLTTQRNRDDRGWRSWSGKRRPQQHRHEPQFPNNATLQANRFEADNINGHRIREAIDDLRAHGVRVRLLELPLATTSLVESDPAKNTPYRLFVEALVDDKRIKLIRPPVGLLTDHDYFDDGHLLPAGAEKLSRWLARDVASVLSDQYTYVAPGN